MPCFPVLACAASAHPDVAGSTPSPQTYPAANWIWDPEHKLSTPGIKYQRDVLRYLQSGVCKVAVIDHEDLRKAHMDGDACNIMRVGEPVAFEAVGMPLTTVGHRAKQLSNAFATQVQKGEFEQLNYTILPADPSVVTVTPSYVTFDERNWNLPQLLNVTAVDNFIDNADVKTKVYFNGTLSFKHHAAEGRPGVKQALSTSGWGKYKDQFRARCAVTADVGTFCACDYGVVCVPDVVLVKPTTIHTLSVTSIDDDTAGMVITPLRSATQLVKRPPVVAGGSLGCGHAIGNRSGFTYTFYHRGGRLGRKCMAGECPHRRRVRARLRGRCLLCRARAT